MDFTQACVAGSHLSIEHVGPMARDCRSADVERNGATSG